MRKSSKLPLETRISEFRRHSSKQTFSRNFFSSQDFGNFDGRTLLHQFEIGLTLTEFATIHSYKPTKSFSRNFLMHQDFGNFDRRALFFTKYKIFLLTNAGFLHCLVALVSDFDGILPSFHLVFCLPIFESLFKNCQRVLCFQFLHNRH